MAQSARISELEQLIKKYSASYYQGEGEISDAEFDALWDELKTLDPENDIFKKVGSDVISGGNFEKARHRIPMGSQEKAANPEQFLAWAVKHPYKEYLVEYKLDGASLELQYENGRFVKAVTRGDGEIGDDITRNALKMKGLVKELPEPFTGGVRGEVIMSHQVHDTHFADKANCRNAANGLMKRKDGTGSEYLEVICYDAYFPLEENTQPSPFADEVQKMAWLTAAGFTTVPVQVCTSADAVIEYRAEVMEIRKDLPFDIDGLVIKNRPIDMEDASRTRPDKQIAFKFSLEEAVSVVRRVIWNENGATYTPVAEFDTVELAGTKVSRASLSNPNTIRDLGLMIGSHVVVTKRGEIIPKIEYVVKNPGETDDLPLFATDLAPVEIPHTCGTCGATLQNDGTRLYCPNKACSKRVLHQLEKYISVIDIRDFGTTLINNLFKAGLLNSISDIYRLTEETLTPFFLEEESIASSKESLGAKKVLAAIEKSRTIPLAKVIAGLDIEGIGETMVEKLIEHGFTSLESLLSATEEQIADCYGFADITARTLVQGLAENRAELEQLVAGGTLTITAPDTQNGALAGLTFCFTGELYTMKRKDAENLVKSLGGSAK
ncbi:MAG: NAD-dependent DNA ligase LigA, partial [Treponemataceae bacterium]|nr:NAD-dependent DNA ligase LigA [Treponemataceae bacterium]